jgi:hypothetical protein
MLGSMKLPSLQRLMEQAVAVARRFPLVLTCGVIAAVAGSLMIDAGEDTERYLRILFASSLGLPLFVGLEMLAQRHGWKGIGKLVSLLGGVAFLVLVYLLRPGWSDDVALSRFFQLALGLHLFVAVGPYLSVQEKNGFWQYNMTLFLRFLLAGVFAAVLYFGLSIALLAVENLFGLDVDGDWYGRLWFTMAFVFHPWVFLGGVPEDLPALEARTTYPHGLKVFAQYVLAPIVTLYLVILTLYMGKILFTQEWPSGWIGWLVSSVAAAGILSLLLLHPVEEKEEDRWVQTYARGFYVALIPSIAMLLMAIWKRIEQYGVTERRYFLVALSLWLTGIAVFFILRRRGSIKVIPASLGLLTFLTIAGPWGAYAVSERSQVARLEEILTRNDMMSDGRVRAAENEVSFEDRREISAVIRYLTETHGVAGIEPWFEGGLASIDSVSADSGPSSRAESDARTRAIVSAMGIDYVDQWAGVTESRFYFTASSGESPLHIAGYDFMLRDRSIESDTILVEGRKLVLAWDEETSRLELSDDAGLLGSVSVLAAVEAAMAFRSDSSGTGPIPARILMAEARNERARMTVYLNSISGARETETADGDDPTDSIDIEAFSADVFFTVLPLDEEPPEVIE